MTLEEIFTQAVALDQSGRLRNEIYCRDKTIYIFGADRTVIMKNTVPRGKTFENEVSFFANDYESDKFYERDGKIVFETQNADFVKTKRCKSPSMSFSEVEELFEGYMYNDLFGFSIITINSTVDPLLEEGLSHIEFAEEDGQLVLLQRDLFSGSIIKINKKKQKGFKIEKGDTISKNFRPIAMRTGDFKALFTFNPQLHFHIPPKGEYFVITGSVGDFKAVVSGCLYDDLGTINQLNKETEDNGRKEQKGEQSQPSADRKPDEGARPRRFLRKS